MPNKLSQFWQELKRRNVIRVITVYAGAAFVIIELINNITEPLLLPDWTPTLVIVLLAIGFPIVIIFSWLYDIHPEGGIVKTDPVEIVKTADNPKPSNSWKIASYISFVVIVGLIVLNIFPRIGKEEILEKSIAVLPFSNESSDQENTYFINGMMESILNNLCKIEELRVVSRNSVEHYRNNPKPTPVVANEMDVSYVLEGSGQKVGNRLLLTIQLIIGNEDRHIWSKQYDRIIERVEDLIDIQLEIAELVVDEIEAVITPEERAIIENVPTINLTAYDFYQRGREEHIKFWLDQTNMPALKNAIAYYKKAMALDPYYAEAYTGLAFANLNFILTERSLYKQFSVNLNKLLRDSVLSLVDKALSIDENMEEAYHARGIYYRAILENDQAIEEMDKAIAINPNYGLVYDAKAGILFYGQGRWIEGIETKLKTIELERGDLLPALLRGLGWFYEHAGFNDKAIEIYEQILQLTHDTVMYYEQMAGPAFCDKNWELNIHFCSKIIEMDPEQYWPYSQLPLAYWNIGKYDSAYYYMEKLSDFGGEKLTYTGDYELIVGKYNWDKGRKKEAKVFLDNAEDYFTYRLENKEGVRDFNLMCLARIDYIKGEYDEALRQISRIDLVTVKPRWFIVKFEELYTFGDLHSDERFQQILNTMKSKWQVEHDKVEKWLEERDM